MTYFRVGDLEIQPDHREILRNGELIRLRPLTFDLLVFLIAHRDRVVSKEELLERLWKGTTVTENSLMQGIGEIRKALADDARQPRLIKTVVKTGYRFIAPVEEIDSHNQSGIDPDRDPCIDSRIDPGIEPIEAVAAPLPSAAGLPPSRTWQMGLAPGALVMIVLLIGGSWVRPAAAKHGGDWSMTGNLEAYRYYTLGVEKAQQLHAAEAVALFEKAIALDPQFAMAHARIGYAYSVAWGRSEIGKPHFERAFQLSSQLPDGDRLYLAAWYAQANQDYESAVRVYRDLLHRFPEETEAYLGLANVLIGEERFDEADQVVRKALQVDPTSPQAYNLLSGVDLGLFQFDAAVTAAQRFVALLPHEPNTYDSLGLAYESQGSFKEAEAAYRTALQIQPNFEISIIHLANTLYRRGHYGEARKEFEHYIAVAPSPNERNRGYSQIALLQRALGDRAGADEAIAKASTSDVAALLALDHNDVRLADQFLSRQPRPDDRGRRISPRLVLYVYGRRAVADGNFDQAVSYFQQALAARPAYWALDWYEDCLGDAYLEAGRADEAILEYRRVVARYPNLALVWYHLGQAYRQKGLAAPAREATEKFLELWKDADPNIPERISALDLVGRQL